METIREMRTICQTTAKKDISNYYMRYVSRFFSIYLTRVFLPVGMSADQASFLMIVVGVVSCLFFADPDPRVFLWSSLGLQLWYVLDCVDGEIARYRFYRKEKEIVLDKARLSMTGAYWDYLNHYIVHGLSIFMISYGLFRSNGEPFWLLAGFAGSFFQMLLLAVHDSKSRAFIGKTLKETSDNRVVRAKRSAEGAAPPAPNSHGILKRVFMAIHYSCTFPTVMNAITVTAVLSAAFGTGPDDLRKGLVLYYAVASGIVFVAIAARNLSNKRIDVDFEEQFEICAVERASS